MSPRGLCTHGESFLSPQPSLMKASSCHLASGPFSYDGTFKSRAPKAKFIHDVIVTSPGSKELRFIFAFDEGRIVEVTALESCGHLLCAVWHSCNILV